MDNSPILNSQKFSSERKWRLTFSGLAKVAIFTTNI